MSEKPPVVVMDETGHSGENLLDAPRGRPRRADGCGDRVAPGPDHRPANNGPRRSAGGGGSARRPSPRREDGDPPRPDGTGADRGTPARGGLSTTRCSPPVASWASRQRLSKCPTEMSSRHSSRPRQALGWRSFPKSVSERYAAPGVRLVPLVGDQPAFAAAVVTSAIPRTCRQSRSSAPSPQRMRGEPGGCVMHRSVLPPEPNGADCRDRRPGLTRNRRRTDARKIQHRVR